MNHIKDIIETLKVHINESAYSSQEILDYSDEPFAKYKSASIKFASEDSIRLLNALEKLLKNEK